VINDIINKAKEDGKIEVTKGVLIPDSVDTTLREYCKNTYGRSWNGSGETGKEDSVVLSFISGVKESNYKDKVNNGVIYILDAVGSKGCVPIDEYLRGSHPSFNGMNFDEAIRVYGDLTTLSREDLEQLALESNVE